MDNLLILSCSATKRPDAGTLPAIDRYDGVAYRVLKKALRETPDLRVAVIILSAEFGLIRADAPIPDYERRMTTARAKELQPHVVAQFAQAAPAQYQRVLIHAGQTYAQAIAPLLPTLHRSAQVAMTAGGIGQRLQQLKVWLADC